MTLPAPETSISDHASAAQGDTSESASALTERLAKLESAIEQVGQYSALINQLNDYVKECRNEVASVRRIRKYSVIGSAIIVTFWALLMVCTIFYQPFALWMLASQFKTYFVIAIIAATTLVLTVLLKGAFRNISERHGDDSVPPHIKEAIDAIKPIKDLGIFK